MGEDGKDEKLCFKFYYNGKWNELISGININQELNFCEKEIEEMKLIDFIREHTRMCKAQVGCASCPLGGNCLSCSRESRSTNDIRREVETIKEWAANHPEKTRWTLLMEQYPGLRVDAHYSICARDFGYACDDCDNINCVECWNKPIEGNAEEDGNK